MELTGRITADAAVHTLTDGRQVTNFTIALNDYYRNKAGEKKEVKTFIKCAYWVSPKVAQHLQKGSIISVYGRIGLDVYKNSAGEPQGSLTCHVNDIKFITSAPAQTSTNPDSDTASQSNYTPAPETIDDLPF